MCLRLDARELNALMMLSFVAHKPQTVGTTYFVAPRPQFSGYSTRLYLPHRDPSASSRNCRRASYRRLVGSGLKRHC